MRIFLLSLFLLSAFSLYAQNKYVRDGLPRDSIAVSLEASDSLNNPRVRLDTTGCKLWRIGTTVKPFFTAGSMSAYAIMTDTLSPYDTNRNESFIIHLKKRTRNTILGFWHKYETDTAKDGCIVEYSADTGKTWNNVLGDCNLNTLSGFGIYTDNFYKKTDTLTDGQPAFSGNSDGWQYSRVQLFNLIYVKSTAALNCISYGDLYYRFRFVSDTVQNNKAGWIIDNIKIEDDYYSSGIQTVSASSLNVHPVPANDIVHFPALDNAQTYRLIITDITGRQIANVPYATTLYIAQYTSGMYYYKVTNGEEVYTGKLIKQE